MLNIIKHLRDIRLLFFNILDNNYSIEMGFVQGTYHELNDYQKILKSNQLYKEIVKSFHKLLVISIENKRINIVYHFMYLTLID